MITGIDHLVLLCPEISAAVAAYERLLGTPPVWQSDVPAGASSALFRSGKTGLEILAPAGSGALGDRLNQLLAEHGPGLQTLVFESNSIESDHRIFKRRGLSPEDIVSGASTDRSTEKHRQWRRFRLNDAATGGVRTFVLQHIDKESLPVAKPSAGALYEIDHVVITTHRPDRALGFFGARLGLELLLDRQNKEQSSRLLVFRAGDSGVEVASRGEAGDEVPDRMWGITWKTRDIDAAHARLIAEGLDISDVRVGARPGTRVCTVRDGTLGIPTLVVAGDNRPA